MFRYVEKEIDRKIARVLLEIVLKTDKLHTITYGGLADEVERIFGAPRPFPITLRWPLGRMQRACADCELPPLSTLVVSRSESRNLPGHGYKTAYDEFYDIAHADKPVAEIFEKEFKEIQKLVGSSAWMPLIKHYGLEEAFPEFMSDVE